MTLEAIHTAALASFNRVQTALRDGRVQSKDDRRFYSIPGAQWEGEWEAQFENKPRPEVNKVHSAVMRIINEYRNNRISVDFRPKDGETNSDLADACDGLYRSDEQDSCAQEAYDNAFEEAAGGGFGAWRLTARLEDEYDDRNEKQRIRFEPIYDADTSVYFDLDAKRQNKSDAKECWVIYSMTYEAYTAEFNDDPSTWPKNINTGMYFDWNPPNVVYVAEYYKVEDKRVLTHYYMTEDGEEMAYTEDEIADEAVQTGIAAKGAVKVREHKVRTRKVHKYLMNGARVIEDQGYVAGRYIPIIPVFGKRWFVDNIERQMGAVRLAKDPQRVDNMVLSVLMMTAAATGIEKPILSPEQVLGHEAMWSNDNIENYPYLLANPIEGPDGTPIITGPLGYTKAPSIPPALVALLQVADQALGEILGRPQDAEQLVSNISADAVEMIQGRVDLQSYIYLSNFAKAMGWCGTVWLSMARELYVEESRKMKSIGEMGNVESIELGKPVIDEKAGEMRYTNDLSAADFDVVVDVGPSFNSRREAVVRSLTGLLGNVADPTDQKILQSMILMNMEGEGLGEVREYFRRQLVTMGVLPPNEDERKEMEQSAQQQQQPDANTAYLMAEAEKSLAAAEKLKAETEKTSAQIADVLAAAEKKAAEIDEIMARIPKIKAETVQIASEPSDQNGVS